MKIRPVILCGGSGTRLWPDSKKHQAKQFIDFGGWTLLEKTLDRIKGSLFDDPIISTNSKYLKEIKKHLKKCKIKNCKILLEPTKRNTGPAILAAALTKGIPDKQPMLFLTADHLIEKIGKFNNEIKKNKKYLTDKNIFIFGIKPDTPSEHYGYLITKKIKKNLNKVTRFIEKPNMINAKRIIKKEGYWNSGMFFLRKDSIINNFKKYQKKIYKNTLLAFNKSNFKNKVCYLKTSSFNKNPSKSFDYAILEKMNDINAIKLNIPWSDLGSWKEILLMYNRNKTKYFTNKNTFYRPWGRYTNLFSGKNFLVKQIYVKPKGILSLQKHFYRSEHWVITEGAPKITLNNNFFFKKTGETIFIPQGAIHRIQNLSKKPVKMMEAQLGSILKETDIVRYEDIYGRAN